MSSAPISNAAPESAPVRRSSPAFRRWSFCLLLLALWFTLCRHLSNEWSANQQYSYGWFVPFFAAYLFWLRWEEKEKFENKNSSVEIAAPLSEFRFRPLSLLLSCLLLSLLLPLRLFEVGNPDWRPLSWIHAGIVVALTLLFLWRHGGNSWLRKFAFPVAFIFVAVPWITPIEEPIVQGLMRLVAAIASEMVNLLGVPAQLEGSVIRIGNGVVGVNEACSGVRSLQTSLMIGLLFGELKRLSIARRFALVAAAVTIAFLANCTRAFFLVWIAATRNIEAVGTWHDTAGYAILIAVFLGTIGIAAWLAPKVKTANPATEIPEAVVPCLAILYPAAASISARYFLLPLLWLVAVEVTVEFWYRSHEREFVATPTWNVRWPEQLPGFREIKIDENVRVTLRFDAGREATWPARLEESQPPLPASWSMFFFRWEPGTASIMRARAHRPDICLPNTGWRVTDDHGVKQYAMSDGTNLPFRHFAFARPFSENRGVSAHAFFCQREDRVPREEADRFDLNAGTMSDWSRSDRFRVVLHGLRNQGQQVMEVVILTPHPLDGAMAETEFARLVPQIVRQER